MAMPDIETFQACHKLSRRGIVFPKMFIGLAPINVSVVTFYQGMDEDINYEY